MWCRWCFGACGQVCNRARGVVWGDPRHARDHARRPRVELGGRPALAPRDGRLVFRFRHPAIRLWCCWTISRRCRSATLPRPSLCCHKQGRIAVSDRDVGCREAVWVLLPVTSGGSTGIERHSRFDPRASLNVLPLDQVWYDVSKTIAEADKAPQPTAGTSTDMRLFRLKPFDDEIRAAQKLPSATSVLKDEGAIPLFYEPSLQIDVDGRAQQPYFFRFSDLAAAFEAQQDTGATGLNDPPQPAVASLANVIRGLETGQTSADTLLVAASEAAGVVQRMTGGNGVGMPGGNEATAGNGISKPAPRQDDGGAPFYLSVPFAGGRRV